MLYDLRSDIAENNNISEKVEKKIVELLHQKVLDNKRKNKSSGVVKVPIKSESQVLD